MHSQCKKTYIFKSVDNKCLLFTIYNNSRKRGLKIRDQPPPCQHIRHLVMALNTPGWPFFLSFKNIKILRKIFERYFLVTLKPDVHHCHIAGRTLWHHTHWHEFIQQWRLPLPTPTSGASSTAEMRFQELSRAYPIKTERSSLISMYSGTK